MGYKEWPRNRWINHTDGGSREGKPSYYYVSNRGDYTMNAADYTDTPLFHNF